MICFINDSNQTNTGPEAQRFKLIIIVIVIKGDHLSEKGVGPRDLKIIDMYCFSNRHAQSRLPGAAHRLAE